MERGERNEYQNCGDVIVDLLCFVVDSNYPSYDCNMEYTKATMDGERSEE